MRLFALLLLVAACKGDKQAAPASQPPKPRTPPMRTFDVHADVNELTYATRLQTAEVDEYRNRTIGIDVEVVQGKATMPTDAIAVAKSSTSIASPSLVTWANEHRVLLGIDCEQAVPAALRHVQCTKANDEALARLGKLPNLETLVLVRTKWTDAGLAHLAALTDLRGLDISGDVGFTDEGLRHLAAMTKLESLGIQGHLITGTGFVHFAAMQALHTLNIRYTRATDDSLAALAKLPQLRTLDLPPKISDAGLAHVAALSALEDLTVMLSTITDAGIAKLEALKKLRRLNIAGAAQVTDRAWTHLARMTELESLDVNATAMTNLSLESAAVLPKLRIFEAEGTQIDRVACAKFNEKHPDVCYVAGVQSTRHGFPTME